MPFVSQAQRAYMHIHHPKVAKEFEKHTPKGKKLPKYVARSAHGSGVFTPEELKCGYKSLK